ncbi:MAG: hypothetical protein JWM28_868 [Chitinophagaceae bacterium]|nr:hypothetical protein [Chitinophagaceae bacterium]
MEDKRLDGGWWMLDAGYWILDAGCPGRRNNQLTLPRFFRKIQFFLFFDIRIHRWFIKFPFMLIQFMLLRIDFIAGISVV